MKPSCTRSNRRRWRRCCSCAASLASVVMDATDRAILYQLQRNGRIANNELADLVGLSPSPCLRRVKNLESAGVIVGYTATLDRDAVDCGYEAIVWVTLATVTRDSLLEFEDAVQEIAEITEAARMMGQPDYLLRVVCRDAAAFELLYMDCLARLPHVQTLTSQLAMKTVKRSAELPLRPQ